MPRTIQAILFDLDNTLYDASAGLQRVVDERITQWIMDNLGLPFAEADDLRVRTWRQYGTTAKGLEAEYGLPPKPLYDWAVSQVEPAGYLEPSPELSGMLDRFAAELHVFTNATEVYARKVLQTLGISRHFQRVFDIEYNGWQCKPQEAIYEHIVQTLALPPEQIALVEDNPRNLEPAIKLGMLTVLLDNDEGDVNADLRIETILQLADSLAGAGVQA